MLQNLNKAKKVAAALLIIAIVMLGLSQTALGYTLEPYFKDYLLYKGDAEEGAFLFTNTSEEDQDFLVSVDGYDPQFEEFTGTEVLVTPLVEEFTAKAGEQVEVPYRIEIPASQQEGSYFNILVIEEKLPENLENEGGSANIRAGFGAILAMHIIDEEGSIKGAFKDRTGTLLEVVDRGIPYLRPTKIRYTFQNNSNFVFQPTGEIRLFDEETDGKIDEDRINEEGVMVYPDGEITQEYEFDLWTYENLTQNYKVVARTYSQFDNAYLENMVVVEGYQPVTILIAILGVLVVIYLILVLIRAVVRVLTGKSSKKNSGQSKRSDGGTGSSQKSGNSEKEKTSKK